MPYVLMHTTRQVQGVRQPDRLPHRRRHAAPRAGRHARAERHRPRRDHDRRSRSSSIRTSMNRATGSFILIDPHTNVTVAAGMIRGVVKTAMSCSAMHGQRTRHRPTSCGRTGTSRATERERSNGHRAAVLWFTGLSGSGKSTIARAAGARAVRGRLSDDAARRRSAASRAVRRPGLRRRATGARTSAAPARSRGSSSSRARSCSARSCHRSRAIARGLRGLLPEGSFLEIHIDCEVDECRRRDPKGLYLKADRGEILNFTGITSPYEAPDKPEIKIRSDQQSVAASVEQIMRELKTRGILS